MLDTFAMAHTCITSSSPAPHSFDDFFAYVGVCTKYIFRHQFSFVRSPFFVWANDIETDRSIWRLLFVACAIISFMHFVVFFFFFWIDFSLHVVVVISHHLLSISHLYFFLLLRCLVIVIARLMSICCMEWVKWRLSVFGYCCRCIRGFVCVCLLYIVALIILNLELLKSSYYRFIVAGCWVTRPIDAYKEKKKFNEWIWNWIYFSAVYALIYDSRHRSHRPRLLIRLASLFEIECFLLSWTMWHDWAFDSTSSNSGSRHEFVVHPICCHSAQDSNMNLRVIDTRTGGR